MDGEKTRPRDLMKCVCQDFQALAQGCSKRSDCGLRHQLGTRILGPKFCPDDNDLTDCHRSNHRLHGGVCQRKSFYRILLTSGLLGL